MKSIMFCTVPNIVVLCLLCVACSLYALPNEKKSYFALEHATILYFSPVHLKHVKINTRRYNRQDPVYYFSVNVYFKNSFGNNITNSFYFYEFLSNTYKRSFVELHVKLCDMIEKEPIFGESLKRAVQKYKPGVTCPYGPGEYYLQNCTMNTAQLANFPFQKGRIYINVSITATKEVIIYGYVDFQIREMKVKKGT